jgi:hypothetical protein
MTDWPSDELEKIAAADELQLASARPDREAAKAGDDLGRPLGRRRSTFDR